MKRYLTALGCTALFLSSQAFAIVGSSSGGSGGSGSGGTTYTEFGQMGDTSCITRKGDFDAKISADVSPETRNMTTLTIRLNASWETPASAVGGTGYTVYISESCDNTWKEVATSADLSWSGQTSIYQKNIQLRLKANGTGKYSEVAVVNPRGGVNLNSEEETNSQGHKITWSDGHNYSRTAEGVYGDSHVDATYKLYYSQFNDGSWSRVFTGNNSTREYTGPAGFYQLLVTKEEYGSYLSGIKLAGANTPAAPPYNYTGIYHQFKNLASSEVANVVDIVSSVPTDVSFTSDNEVFFEFDFSYIEGIDASIGMAFDAYEDAIQFVNTFTCGSEVSTIQEVQNITCINFSPIMAGVGSSLYIGGTIPGNSTGCYMYQICDPFPRQALMTNQYCSGMFTVPQDTPIISTNSADYYVGHTMGYNNFLMSNTAGYDPSSINVQSPCLDTNNPYIYYYDNRPKGVACTDVYNQKNLEISNSGGSTTTGLVIGGIGAGLFVWATGGTGLIALGAGGSTIVFGEGANQYNISQDSAQNHSAYQKCLADQYK